MRATAQIPVFRNFVNNMNLSKYEQTLYDLIIEQGTMEEMFNLGYRKGTVDGFKNAIEELEKLNKKI